MRGSEQMKFLKWKYRVGFSMFSLCFCLVMFLLTVELNLPSWINEINLIFQAGWFGLMLFTEPKEEFRK